MSQSCDVLVLAAGFGTRLRPLTERIPKPLITIGEKTLLERHLERLSIQGMRRVIVNVHYLAEQIIEYVGSGERWGLEIVISREDPILDTGGAVKRIEPLLRHDTLLTINSDTLLGPDFSFKPVLDKQRSTNALATLVLRPDPESKRYGEIGVSQDGTVRDYLGLKLGDEPPEGLNRQMFLGVAALSRRVQKYAQSLGEVFSITRDLYPLALKQGEKLCSITYTGPWSDVGTHEALARAQNEVCETFGIS